MCCQMLQARREWQGDCCEANYESVRNRRSGNQKGGPKGIVGRRGRKSQRLCRESVSACLSQVHLVCGAAFSHPLRSLVAECGDTR